LNLNLKNKYPDIFNAVYDSVTDFTDLPDEVISKIAYRAGTVACEAHERELTKEKSMSDDLKDLVTSTDVPSISKQEMRKTHANQHQQAKKITGKAKKTKK
jgi:hypothetical protein